MNRLKPLTNKKNALAVQLDGFATRHKNKVGDARCYYYNLSHRGKFIHVDGEATETNSDRYSASFNHIMKDNGYRNL